MKQKLHFLFLIEAVSYTGNYDCLTRVTEKICKQGEFPTAWMNEVYRVCNCEDKEKRYQLRKAFAGVDTEESYFLILKAWCAEQDGGDVQAALQECLEQGLDCAVPREELLGICLRNNIDPSPFLEPLYLDDWTASFVQLVKHMPKEELQHLLDCAQRTLHPINESYYFILAKMIRQRLLNDPDFLKENLWETVQSYVEDILGYSKSIYRQELFEDSQHSLPREMVFALQLKKALEARKQGHFDQMTERFKECVKAYPPRKDLVNRLLGQVERDMQAEQQYQDEFMAMGEKIKQQIHQMIQLGKLAESQEILERLKVLLPNDAELKELEEKISMGERLRNLQSLMH